MKFASPWFDRIVNRTNRTPAVPAVGVYAWSCPSLGAFAVTAVRHGAFAFFRVSIVNAFTPASGPSPQVPPETTPKVETSTAVGSCTTVLRGPETPLLPFVTESDGHPAPKLRSNAPLAFVPQNGP